MKITFVTNDSIEIPFDSLISIKLDGVNLHRALLENVDMHNSSFIETNFRGAFLAKSNLSYCDFSNAILITAFFMECNLNHANLGNSVAIACNFTKGQLKNVNFNNADVTRANFSHCNLAGSIMTANFIETAIFENATYDDKTIWPQDFDPDKAGCLKIN